MDSSIKSADHLKERIRVRVSAIGRAMRDILEMSQPTVTENKKTGSRITDPPDLTSLAGLTRTHRVEIATQTMVRSSEELLIIIRQMQEIWLFGKLDTLGQSDVEQRTEEDTKKILELLQRLTEVKDSGKADVMVS